MFPLGSDVLSGGIQTSQLFSLQLAILSSWIDNGVVTLESFHFFIHISVFSHACFLSVRLFPNAYHLHQLVGFFFHQRESVEMVGFALSALAF